MVLLTKEMIVNMEMLIGKAQQMMMIEVLSMVEGFSYYKQKKIDEMIDV